MPETRHFIIAAALALAGAGASGQTVYRCGSSYSQQPCAGATEVAGPAAPSAADAAQARQSAAADWRRAEAMEKARLAQEKNAPKAIVIGPQTPVAAEAKPAKDAARTKGKPEQFTAVAPGKARPTAVKKKEKKKTT